MATQEDTANLTTQLSDEIAAHTVDLLRFSASVQNDILLMLDTLQADIIRNIDLAVGRGDALTEARLRTLLTQTQKTIASAYTEINTTHNDALQTAAGTSAAHAASSINDAVTVDVASVGFTPNQLETLDSDAFILGRPSDEWWQGQGQSLQDRFTVAMRTGMLQGESVPQLAARVRGTRALGYTDGIMNLSRQQAQTLVRTSVIGVANLSRLNTYADNADLIKAIQWVSVLDDRTTLICIGLDGKQWKMPPSGDMEDYGGYEPIDHNKAFPGPTAHWGCRSTQVSVLKSLDELATQDAYANLPEDIQDPAVRAAMDGQEQVGGTYEDWLNRQDVATQNDILGIGRAELFRAGQLDLTDITDQSNDPLTTEQLIAKYGLPPEPAPPEPPPPTSVKEDLSSRTVSSTAKNKAAGTDGSYVAVFDDGSKAIWKPLDEEAETIRDTVGEDHGRRDVATSDVADMIGMGDLVQATVARELKGQIGSLQAFVDGGVEAGNLSDAEMYDGPKDAARSAAFDYLIGNTDRHTGNWMVTTADNKLHLIDNGLTWSVGNRELKSYFFNQMSRLQVPIPSDVSVWLEKWPLIETYLQEHGFTSDEIAWAHWRLEALNKADTFTQLNLTRDWRSVNKPWSPAPGQQPQLLT